MPDTKGDLYRIVNPLSNEDYLPLTHHTQPATISSNPVVVAPITPESPRGLIANHKLENGPLKGAAFHQLIDNAKPAISPVESVKADLELIRMAWTEYQATKGRDAVYLYLSAIYRTVIIWNQRKRLRRNCELALRIQANQIEMKMEPFSVLIFCTSDHQKVDAKTRSKWSRALRVIVGRKPKGMKLKDFVKSCGGINDCAALFDRKRDVGL